MMAPGNDLPQYLRGFRATFAFSVGYSLILNRLDNFLDKVPMFSKTIYLRCALANVMTFGH